MYMYGTSNIVVPRDIFRVPHRMRKGSERHVRVYKWSKEVCACPRRAAHLPSSWALPLAVRPKVLVLPLSQ